MPAAHVANEVILPTRRWEEQDDRSDTPAVAPYLMTQLPYAQRGLRIIYDETPTLKVFH